MSARDDYPLLLAMVRANEDDSLADLDELLRAFDEIDRLRRYAPTRGGAHMDETIEDD